MRFFERADELYNIIFNKEIQIRDFYGRIISEGDLTLEADHSGCRRNKLR